MLLHRLGSRYKDGGGDRRGDHFFKALFSHHYIENFCIFSFTPTEIFSFVPISISPRKPDEESIFLFPYFVVLTVFSLQKMIFCFHFAKM